MYMCVGDVPGAVRGGPRQGEGVQPEGVRAHGLRQVDPHLRTDLHAQDRLPRALVSQSPPLDPTTHHACRGGSATSTVHLSPHGSLADTASDTPHRVMNVRRSIMSGIAQSAYKMCGDIRLLANLKEIEEPFGKDQVSERTYPHSSSSRPLTGFACLCGVVWCVDRLERHGLQAQPHAVRARLLAGPLRHVPARQRRTHTLHPGTPPPLLLPRSTSAPAHRIYCMVCVLSCISGSSGPSTTLPSAASCCPRPSWLSTSSSPSPLTSPTGYKCVTTTGLTHSGAPAAC